MYARWYNGGLLIEPESDEDSGTLMGVMNLLKLVKVGDRVKTSPVTIVEANDEQAIIDVDQFAT